jgi:hypothetical protein
MGRLLHLHVPSASPPVAGSEEDNSERIIGWHDSAGVSRAGPAVDGVAGPPSPAEIPVREEGGKEEGVSARSGPSVAWVHGTVRFSTRGCPRGCSCDISKVANPVTFLLWPDTRSSGLVEFFCVPYLMMASLVSARSGARRALIHSRAGSADSIFFSFRQRILQVVGRRQRTRVWKAHHL